jgi:hypothetical protein
MYHYLIVFQWPNRAGWAMRTMSGILPAGVRTRTEAIRLLSEAGQDHGVPVDANITFLSIEPEDL